MPHAEVRCFADKSSENYEDFTLDTAVRHSLGVARFVFGGLEHSWGHEYRSSPDDANGLKPTEFTDANAYVGIGRRAGGNSYRVGVNIRDLDFDDTPADVDATINNDDRDRLETEIGGRLGVASFRGGEAFVHGIYDRRSYDTATDDLGFGRMLYSWVPTSVRCAADP